MPNPLTTPQSATARLATGRTQARVRVTVTPIGLLAIGGLVAAVLLSVAPIVRAAGDARRAAGRGAPSP